MCLLITIVVTKYLFGLSKMFLLTSCVVNKLVLGMCTWTYTHMILEPCPILFLATMLFVMYVLLGGN